MVLDTNALSQLYASEAAPSKAKQLFKFLDEATPSELCATLKTTGHLTKQSCSSAGRLSSGCRSPSILPTR
jgi:hypothetical protein